MHPYIPPSTAHEHFIELKPVTLDGQVSPGKRVPGRFNRPGGMLTKRLRIVCTPCNNGWMSVLQNTIKQILLPFITGGWPTLNPTEQQLLAAWITMFVMVVEKSNEEGVTTSQAKRTAFMEQGEARKPPNNWLIWLCSHDDKDNVATFSMRTVGVREKTPQVPGPVGEYVLASKITLFSLNKLGVIVISIADDDVSSTVSGALKNLASNADLRPLWPPTTIRGPRKPLRTHALSRSSDFLDSAATILLQGAAAHWQKLSASKKP
jgi:hypothetical protein